MNAFHGLPTQFPGAGQPDIVRASQKDELYLQYLTDACLDAVRGLLGPRRALLWMREVRLFSELLYHGLTTGAGLQTLGEEYCDILQVSGAGGVAPGVIRRGMLVLLQTVAPYIVEHLPGPESFDLHAQPRYARMSSHGSFVSHPIDDDLHEEQHASTSGRAEQHQPWLQQIQGITISAREQALLVWAWLSRNSQMLARLHLALFYFYGLYYAWPKRATGVRYIFIGKLFERRSSYHVLGMLLFAQIAASVSLQGLQQLAAQWLPGRGADGSSTDAKEKPLLPAVVLREDSDEEQPPATSKPPQPNNLLSSTAAAAEVPPHRRCPLCLSARDCPTSTPCGHVFCWRCICEWGIQKPECPLCRAPFAPQSLVCLHGSDF